MVRAFNNGDMVWLYPKGIDASNCRLTQEHYYDKQVKIVQPELGHMNGSTAHGMHEPHYYIELDGSEGDWISSDREAVYVSVKSLRKTHMKNAPKNVNGDMDTWVKLNEVKRACGHG